MTQAKILYDGIDAFYPQPTPFVGLEEENVYYNEYWGKLENLTLEGQITGCNFEDIVAAQKQLVDNFQKNYQTLEIWQTDDNSSGKIFSKELVEVVSLEFNSSLWVGILPYTIGLRCYPSGYFSGGYGILNPVDTWNFAEGQNYSSQITHTISCQGINTSSAANNALENAKNWALARRNADTFVTPALIENLFPENICLVSSNEEIDRLNGTYSITDSYSSDLTRTGYGILRYSTAFISGNDRIIATLNGSVQGCGQNIAAVRQTYQSLDKAAAVAISYKKIFNKEDLNPKPLSFRVDEDPYNANLTFEFQYDNDNSPDVYFDYTATLTSGNTIGATISGPVIARGGDVNSKLNRAKDYAKTVNLYNLTTAFYNDFYPYASLYPLNPKPVSSGIAINESNGTVQLNADFTNQEVAEDGLDSFEYEVRFVPSLIKIDGRPILDGMGMFSNVSLGYANRAFLSIEGSARISPNTSSSAGVLLIKQKAMNIFSTYGRTINAALEANSINISRFDEKLISFNFAWSFDSPNQVTTPSSYSNVNTLVV